jgi:SAM-dependent methyltransferase
MTNHRLSDEQWSQYWRRDSITTFRRRGNENYDREFAEFWNSRFAELSDRSFIIDLATGNGAVALLAAAFAVAHDKEFEVTGIDFADIRPLEVLAGHEEVRELLSRIRFLAKTRMEATGLPAGSANLVMSQYGIEYGDLAATIAEAWRLLREGGTLAAILHHAESAVVKLAEDNVGQVEYCLQDEQLDKRVLELVRSMGDARTPADRARLKFNPKTESLRNELNTSVARINERAKCFRDPEGVIGVLIPNFLNVFLAHKDRSLAERIQYVQRVRSEFDGFRERMADLRRAALSESDAARLVKVLEAAGFVVRERGVLHYGPKRDLMGWTVIAAKLASARGRYSRRRTRSARRTPSTERR